MNVNEYLKRIGYSGERSPTESVLEKLCWAHVTNVPFYTLDLFGSGERKVMELELIYRKIVTEGVGGMCYELNALFAWLLRQLGFVVRIVEAESLMGSNKDYGGSLFASHLTLVVEFPEGQKRIADVSSLALPLKFDTEEAQDQRNTKARARKVWCDREKDWFICVEKLARSIIDETDSEQIVDDKKNKGLKWKGRFRFPIAVPDSNVQDFQKHIDAAQDHEDSEFKHVSFCVLQTQLGMKALICRTYLEKEYIDDYKERKVSEIITNYEDVASILKDKFKVTVNHTLDLPDLENNVF